MYETGSAKPHTVSASREHSSRSPPKLITVLSALCNHPALVSDIATCASVLQFLVINFRLHQHKAAGMEIRLSKSNYEHDGVSTPTDTMMLITREFAIASLLSKRAQSN